MLRNLQYLIPVLAGIVLAFVVTNSVSDSNAATLRTIEQQGQ